MQPRLFKDEGNSDDFKKYLPVNVNTSFRTLATFLGLAELKYIRPLLGNLLYEEITTFAKTDEKTLQLIDYLKYAEINLAFYCGWSVLSTSISDSGASSKADGDKRLYRYQEVEILETFKNNGFNILDTVLDFLHEHIADFELFKNADFYKKSQKTLIPTTAIFNAIYPINNSRLVFLKMTQYIKLVEDIELHHYFGSQFVSELMTADLETDKYREIAENIRNFIVYLSVSKGIGELKKLPTEKGLIFESTSDFVRDGYMQSQVEGKELETTLIFCEKTAKSYLATAINCLKKQSQDFPKFIAHAGENSNETSSVFRNNKHKRTFFMPINT